MTLSLSLRDRIDQVPNQSSAKRFNYGYHLTSIKQVPLSLKSVTFSLNLHSQKCRFENCQMRETKLKLKLTLCDDKTMIGCGY